MERVHAALVRHLTVRLRKGGLFRRDTRGAVAIEFAVVSIPFFMLLLGILEIALVIFAAQVLDTAVADAARQIRTGQVQQSGISQTQFKQLICNSRHLVGMFDCSKIEVDVESAATFPVTPPGSPLSGDGSLSGNFGYDPGGAREAVVVRVFYPWPVIMNFFGVTLANMSGGNRLLSSTVAFRNEPFPW